METTLGMLYESIYKECLEYFPDTNPDILEIIAEEILFGADYNDFRTMYMDDEENEERIHYQYIEDD